MNNILVWNRFIIESNYLLFVLPVWKSKVIYIDVNGFIIEPSLSFLSKIMKYEKNWNQLIGIQILWHDQTTKKVLF